MLASAEQWTAQKAAAATAVGRGEAEARLNAARRDERDALSRAVFDTLAASAWTS